MKMLNNYYKDLEYILKDLEKEGLVNAELKISGKIVRYSGGKLKIFPATPDLIEDFKKHSKKIILLVGLLLLLYFILGILVNVNMGN